MEKVTLELTKEEWIKVVLALHTKADARELELSYCESLEELAFDIEKRVLSELKEKGGN